MSNDTTNEIIDAIYDGNNLIIFSVLRYHKEEIKPDWCETDTILNVLCECGFLDAANYLIMDEFYE